MFKLITIAALTLALFSLPVSAATADCIKKYLRDAQEIGHGEGRRFIFHAYDAQLVAPHGTFDSNKAFALTLTYRMQFSGQAIAHESAAQMRRMGTAREKEINRWTQDMQAIFPDVKPGMSITGLHLKNGKTIFCTADGELGRIVDRAFATAFFGIWLSDKAESQTLRHQLIGQP